MVAFGVSGFVRDSYMVWCSFYNVQCLAVRSFGKDILFSYRHSVS